MDNGDTFEKLGLLIPEIYDRNFNNGSSDGGYGEPSITYNIDSSEVFVYYTDHTRVGKNVNISMVKFNIINDSIDFHHPFFLQEGNTFTNEIIRSKHLLKSNESYVDFHNPFVFYNKFFKKYYMLFNLNKYSELGNKANISGIYYTTSKDGINWDNSNFIQIVKDFTIYFNSKDSYSWHPSLFFDNETQDSGYFIYSKGSNGLPHKMYCQKFKFLK